MDLERAPGTVLGVLIRLRLAPKKCGCALEGGSYANEIIADAEFFGPGTFV